MKDDRGLNPWQDHHSLFLRASSRWRAQSEDFVTHVLIVEGLHAVKNHGNLDPDPTVTERNLSPMTGYTLAPYTPTTDNGPPLKHTT